MVALNEDVYLKAAENLREMKIQMISANDLIDSIVEMGMDATKALENQATLQAQIDKWEGLLTRKGYWP